ncbi:EpsG family protein [Cetobacterium somerae]|uniref:EpsG family protein n=1 Tax=Cetobacterium sp. NK01 TaxID=2993530 RepID=UPI00211653C3|nr:EpsG family protein [Cetobacterium sp. NK01]MCQ8212122.1 EpsG family protein [Cetobacterium sp. NK01]
MKIYYIIGLILISTNTIFSERKLKFFNIIIIFFITAFAYKIHNDFAIYERVYNSFNSFSIEQTRFEIGYKSINLIFSMFLNFYEFKALLYFVNIILIYKGIKAIYPQYQKYVWSFLYFYGPYYLFWLTAIRQSIAISIVIYSYHFLYENNVKKYTLCILIATLFHKSALLMLVMIFIQKIRISRTKIVVGYIFSIIILLFGNSNFFNTMFSLIKEDLVKKNISILNLVLYSILLIASILTYFKNTKFKDRREIFLFKNYIMFMIVFFLSLRLDFIYRILPYLSIFLGIEISEIFERIKLKKIKFISLIIIFLIFQINTIKNLNRKDGRLVPYNSYIETFFYKIPYEETSEYKHVKSRDK